MLVCLQHTRIHMDACCICLSSGFHSGLLINQNDLCSLLGSVPMKMAVFSQLFIVGADWRDAPSCMAFMCVTLLQLPVTLKTLTSWLRTARSDLSDAECFQAGLAVHHLFMEWTVGLRKQHLRIHTCCLWCNVVGWSSDIIRLKLVKTAFDLPIYILELMSCEWKALTIFSLSVQLTRHILASHVKNHATDVGIR